MACDKRPAPTDAPPSNRAAPKASVKPVESQDGVFSADAGKVETGKAIIREMRVRHSCNRVMGCSKLSIRLAGLGPSGAQAILDVLAVQKDSDGYWVTKCIDILGQIGRHKAAVYLASLLHDKRTEIRARSAIALGRLADPATREMTADALKASKNSVDIGYRMALLFALDRIGPFSVERRRQAAALLPTDMEGLGKLNPLFLMVAAEVAREWPIPEALPALRLMSRHIGVFVRRESIRALGRLRDTGAIATLVGRLSDEVPSVRRASIRALQEITGNRRFGSADEWRAWCDRTECKKTKTKKAEKPAIKTPEPINSLP